MRKQPQEIIKELENTTSRLEKESILHQALEDDSQEFFVGLRFALDPLITFGVKRVSEKTGDGQGLPWAVFEDLAQRLRDRELTGHAALDAIELVKGTATAEQWNGFYRRILIKDLRCGVSDRTVNKVSKSAGRAEWCIPIFSCQLAHDGANHTKKISGERLLEYKIDGVRTLVVIHDVHGENIELFSRNGKKFNNFNHIAEEIRSVLEKNPAPYPLVLDGEITSDNFQKLMKQVYRKSDVAANDAVLYLFDLIPLKDFQAGFWNTQQMQRTGMIYLWARDNAGILEHVRYLDWEFVNLDSVQGQEHFRSFNQKAIQNGYEGIMIKDPDAPYQCKRSHAWLKAKPFIEVTLEIKRVEEGTGRNAGRLGALVCAGVDDDKHITVNVGSGFSDLQRKELWASRNNIPGQLIEIRADAITQNQDKTYSLRFPRFKRFRGFVSGEKI